MSASIPAAGRLSLLLRLAAGNFLADLAGSSRTTGDDSFEERVPA
jgi:hypothetical protein